MLDILQQKLLSWSPEKADQFYNNMPRFVPTGNRIWEIAPTGYFLYDSTYSAYFDYNGKVYSLLLGDLSVEYTNKQALSDASVEYNSIPIERPDLIQITTIYEIIYTYVEESRPYNNLGFCGLNIACLNADLETGTDIVETERAKIKEQLKDLSIKAGQNDYSEYIDMYEHVYYDPGTQSYFLVGRFPVKKSIEPSDIFNQYITDVKTRS
jgi:hypothetical protein